MKRIPPRGRSAAVVAVASAAAFVLAACGGGSSSGESSDSPSESSSSSASESSSSSSESSSSQEAGCTELAPASLQLQWFVQAQFAGYYAAKDKGFYEEQCLDVTILEGGVDIVPQTVLAQGGSDFAISWV
ncbi:MAG: ABC transporter substrate-binding protein, partial [Candidatus Nanopelagicales bacterium]